MQAHHDPCVCRFQIWFAAEHLFGKLGKHIPQVSAAAQIVPLGAACAVCAQSCVHHNELIHLLRILLYVSLEILYN